MRSKSGLIESCIPYDGKSHQWPQIFAVIVSTLGSISTGALITWTSPSISILTSNSSHLEPITLEEASYFTVIPGFSAVIASPFFAVLLDKIGRRKVLMIMALLYLLSWILIIGAENVYVLYASRIAEGIGDAALFTTVPTYVGETTDPKIRGSWGNLIAWSWYLGQFFVNTIGSYCDIRTTAWILSSVPIIQFILTFFIPESPYYLIKVNKEKEAIACLQYLMWKEDVTEEFKTLKKDVHRQISESGHIKELFTNAVNRRAFLVSVGLRATQQFSGLPAFFLYTQYMFEQAGSDLSASTSSIIFCGVLLVVVTGAIFVIDRCGRKPLMTYSCLGCGVVMLFEATYFYIHEMTSVNTSEISWFPLAGMLAYVPICTIGVGILPGVMFGELFSASIKGKALGLLNMCYSIFVLLVSKGFQLLSSNFGMYVPFSFFTVSCFVGVAFCYYFVPETKGKTLEEIQQDLRGKSKEEKSIETEKEEKC